MSESIKKVDERQLPALLRELSRKLLEWSWEGVATLLAIAVGMLVRTIAARRWFFMPEKVS